MIPLHIPYYSQNAQNVLKNFDLGSNKINFHTQLSKIFESDFNLKNTYLTKSCTNALEAIALLLDLKSGDEVIIPSYTFVSTANAFAIFGAKLIYADSNTSHPNVDTNSILSSITDKTKAIVVMHYGGVAVDNLHQLRTECDKRNIFLIEDAAHCLGAYLNQQHLGTFGHASTFSFHESKNITCIEGGLLVINHEPWLNQIDSILNKGTNRAQFEKKQTLLYEWVSTGSSFMMNSLHAAILNEQVKSVKEITDKRLELFNYYLKELKVLRSNNHFNYFIPEESCKHNAHNFWIELPDEKTRNELQKYLIDKGVYTTFHYLALHNSPFGKKYRGKINLPNAEKFEKTLLRLPLYYQQTLEEATRVVDAIKKFFSK